MAAQWMPFCVLGIIYSLVSSFKQATLLQILLYDRVKQN